MDLMQRGANVGIARRFTQQTAGGVVAWIVVLLVCTPLVGCGSATPPANVTQPAPQTYFAPFMNGESLGSTPPAQSIFSFDDTAKTFYQSTEVFSDQQFGTQTFYSGNIGQLARGLMALGTTYSYNQSTSTGTTYNPPQTGNWAVELPGQAGGLVQLTGQVPVPLVATNQCPSNTSPQTYEFISLPAALNLSGPSAALQWNPNLETAYGSADISGSSGTVQVANIQQSTLPPGGNPGAPAVPFAVTTTGACGSGFYGELTQIPSQIAINDPGQAQTVVPPASFGLDPSGLLVEANGNSGKAGTNGLTYTNVLGAGTGAIGLMRPSSPVSVSSFVSAQYIGFFYEAGNIQGGTPSSLVASFGFPTLPNTCQNVSAQTNSMIYGGDFLNNDPSTSTVQMAGGYGNCDFAIDLGAQDPKNNGLFPSAQIYIGAAYTGNRVGKSYFFPAVAIAGQLKGKNAIFLLGVDTTGSPQQAWGIYLIQSN